MSTIKLHGECPGCSMVHEKDVVPWVHDNRLWFCKNCHGVYGTIKESQFWGTVAGIGRLGPNDTNYFDLHIEGTSEVVHGWVNKHGKVVQWG